MSESPLDTLKCGPKFAHGIAASDQAVAFCERTGVDAFAPAIGTAHGLYKGKPKIAFELFERIEAAVKPPLVIHGGTGLSEEVFSTMHNKERIFYRGYLTKTCFHF